MTQIGRPTRGKALERSETPAAEASTSPSSASFEGQVDVVVEKQTAGTVVGRLLTKVIDVLEQDGFLVDVSDEDYAFLQRMARKGLR